MKTLVLLGLSVFAFVFSGCATQRIFVQDQLGGNTPSYEKSQAFFIGGIGQTQDTNAAEICGKRGIRRVETERTFVDILLGVITFSIYTPQSVAVYCNRE